MTQLHYTDSDDDITMHPPFTQRTLDDNLPLSAITGRPIPRPSDSWMRRPAYIDGARDPPSFFHSPEAIEEAVTAWGPRIGIWPEPSPSVPSAPDTPLVQSYALDAAMARATPTPIPTAAVTLALQEGDVGTPSNGSELQGDGEATASASTPASNDYIIRSTFVYPAALVPGAKAAAKKNQSTVKVLSVDLPNVTRVQFLTAILVAQGLNQSFSPGMVSGFPIKMYWNGSAGGKTNAASILTDADFEMNRSALFRRRTKPEVSVEFTSTDLEAFRIQEVSAQNLATGAGADDNPPELAYGTQVPQVSSFTTSAQLHGVCIMELKRKHQCAEHCGEHGEAGCCYVAPDGSHLRLNNYRLKLWAAAWVAGEATKHQPPNGEAFDGPRDGGPSVRPRGRGGPHTASTDTGAGNNNDITNIILGALLPTLAGLSRKRARSPSSSPRHYRTPPRASTSRLSPPFSPLPSPGSEVAVFLVAFNTKEGIDFTSYTSAFEQLDLTPDVIPSADPTLIADICMTTIGKALKLKIFCSKWNTRFSKKCHRSE